MIKFHNRVLKEAKLPLSVCRGNQKDRRKLAQSLNYSFLKRLKGYDSLDSYILTRELDTFMGKNKINISFSEEPAKSKNIATLAPKYSVAEKDGQFYGIASGYDLRFKNLKNLKKQYVAHEFSHFFEKITNPKVLNVEGAPYIEKVEEWKLCEGVLDKYFRPLSQIENEKGAVNDIHATVQSVPKDMRISALKLYRKQLITEKNAYYDEKVWTLKFAKGPKEKFQAVREYLEAIILDKTTLQFKKKERILKKVIFKVFHPDTEI